MVQQLSSKIQAEGNLECSQPYYADDLPSCWRSPLRSSVGMPGRMPGGFPGGGFPGGGFPGGGSHEAPNFEEVD